MAFITSPHSPGPLYSVFLLHLDILIVIFNYNLWKNNVLLTPEESKRRTIYEYNRVEVNTTKIVNRSAFMFIPLPSKCALAIQTLLSSQCEQTTVKMCIVNTKLSLIRINAGLYQCNKIKQIFLFVLLYVGELKSASNTPAVINVFTLTSPQTVGGATSFRGTTSNLQKSPCLSVSVATNNICYGILCVHRCSDGIDRHRQEWFDYGCSEEVGKTDTVFFTCSKNILSVDVLCLGNDNI